MNWLEAALSILSDGKERHYDKIAGEVIIRGLKNTKGLTPGLTLNRDLLTHLRKEGYGSLVVQVRRGVWKIKATEQSQRASLTTDVTDSKPNSDSEELEKSSWSGAFAFYWRSEDVDWTRSQPEIFGRSGQSRLLVDFSSQIGIYFLHSVINGVILL
ncbi:MAG: hypothetical protein FJY67_11105 [Calditrichaeota bacterium]|nr:hypothetical protein [Calditrichota bacterium]